MCTQQYKSNQISGKKIKKETLRQGVTKEILPLCPWRPLHKSTGFHGDQAAWVLGLSAGTGPLFLLLRGTFPWEMELHIITCLSITFLPNM